MGKPSAPPAPDYAAAARQQGVENTATARVQARLNTPNVVTPYGSQTVTFGAKKVDQAGYDQAMQDFNNRQEYDSNGNLVAGTAPTIEQFTTDGDADTATVTQTLDPESQAALEAQQRIGRGLSETAERYALPTIQDFLKNRFDTSGYDVKTSFGDNQTPQGVDAGLYGNLKTDADLSGVAAMPVNAGTTGQAAIMARLQPQLAQQSAATAQQLANQGITPGSEAYNNAMRQQQQSQNDLLSQAALQGIGLDMTANQQGYGQAMERAGFYNTSQGQGFGQAIAARQQGNEAIGQDYNQRRGAAQFGNEAQQQRLQQNLTLRNQPMNEILGLLSGAQIQTPQFQGYAGGGNIRPADVAGAATNQGNYNTAAYNARMGALGGLYSGLGSIAGGALAM